MLGLQLPTPMPSAIPREKTLDFYSPSRSASQYNTSRQMQLPVPRISRGYEHLDAYRAASLPPITPPFEASRSAVREDSRQSHEGRQQYTYQLPALGHSNRAATTRSPTPQGQLQHQSSQDMSQQQQRRLPISPNLRIPPSIRAPQESLPQLAAEVTCLFWFENSSTLKQVLDGKSPRPTQPLVPDAIPTTGFRKWVATILTTTQVAQNVIILALLFIYRLKKTNPAVKGKPGSEFRLLTVALMLGNKFLDDNTYTNKTWAEVTGISVQEVHIMEVEFLSNMRYSLFTSEKDWDEWHVLLGKFGTFYDRASKMPTSGAISPVGPLTPSFQAPPQYNRSPPSQQVSPSNALAYSPYRTPFSNAPSLQPQTAANGTMPEIGPITQRKRSTDNSVEPPPKRIAHGFAAGPYSNAPLIPALQMPASRSSDSQRSINRLPPLPSLSIPQPQQIPPVQVSTYPDLALPAPGSRSMAMVYPPPGPASGQWKQPLITPTSTAAPSYPSSQTPSAGDRSRQGSPYHISAASSPSSATYTSSSQKQLSPSYFLSQRQSPYRPVRGVQTLLVPPPSTAMHDAAQNIGYDQMQYHLLGRPMNERRPGPLPYLDNRAWPETHQYTQQLVPQQQAFHR